MYPRTARQLYRKVLHDYRGTPAAENALYGLGHLYVDPDGPLRDYTLAHVAFGRLVAEYPDSIRAPEARAWQALLSELLHAQADLRRSRGELDRLKAMDIEEEEQP